MAPRRTLSLTPSVDPYGKKELLEFYSRQLEHFGDAPQAVRWTPRGQLQRFETLLEIAGNLSGREVLDFGCGKGDLYGHLRDRGVRARYCGLDVNEKHVALAARKYPEAEFLCLDIEEEDFHRTFDVILICGVFNLRIAGIADSMHAVLRRLTPLFRESLHLNIPSSRTPVRDIEIFSVDPFELLSFAERELSPCAVLRDGLIDDDLFLSLYRR